MVKRRIQLSPAQEKAIESALEKARLYVWGKLPRRHMEMGFSWAILKAKLPARNRLNNRNVEFLYSVDCKLRKPKFKPTKDINKAFKLVLSRSRSKHDYHKTKRVLRGLVFKFNSYVLKSFALKLLIPRLEESAVTFLKRELSKRHKLMPGPQRNLYKREVYFLIEFLKARGDINLAYQPFGPGTRFFEGNSGYRKSKSGFLDEMKKRVKEAKFESQLQKENALLAKWMEFCGCTKQQIKNALQLDQNL